MTSWNRLLSGCAVLFVCGAVFAGEQVEQSIAADPAGVVEISNVRGEIEVRGWDRDEVRVEGELDDLAEGIALEGEGRRVRIKVKLPGSNIDSGDGSTLAVRVPAASRVEIEGVSSDARVFGVNALALRSVSGDIVVADVAGEVAIKSVSGDIKVDKSGGVARVKSVNGDMTLELGSRELTLSTVSGDIELRLTEFDRLAVTGVSGDMRIAGTLASGGRIEIKTVSGDCELHLAGQVDARISLRTGPGGEIDNALSDAKPQTEFPSQKRLETTLGDGTGSVDIATVSGVIRLLRNDWKR